MGMTIDNAINTINNHSMSFASSDEEAINAIQLLMDVAKKYQKIEQIMESDTYKGFFTYTDDTRFNHIREVLENESN